MNFEMFQHFAESIQFDEVKVIGKEIVKNGKYYYIIGMSRIGNDGKIYVLENCDFLSTHAEYCEKSNKETILESLSRDKNHFVNMDMLFIGDKSLEVQRCSSESLCGEHCKAYLLFSKMVSAGWKLSEESLLYRKDWESMALTEVRLRTEFSGLPTWENEVKLRTKILPHHVPLERSIYLEKGTEPQIPFILEDGKEAICYINRIYSIDIWKEERERFEDKEYQRQILQHVTIEEFENMKQSYFEGLAQNCPEGMHYMAVEYECTEDISLHFYSKEDLDTIPQPREGGVSIILMHMKPDEETGNHGLKLKGCVIQTPISSEQSCMNAELLYYTKMIPSSEEIWSFNE